MGNHPGRSGRFEVSINCAGMGEDWRREVAAILRGLAVRLEADDDSIVLYDRRCNLIGRWSYRPPRAPAPPTGRAAP